MDNEPWQLRAKRAGLTQKRLARLLGVAENTVSRQMRGQFSTGVPMSLKTVVRAYEMLSQKERDELNRMTESDEEDGAQGSGPAPQG